MKIEISRVCVCGGYHKLGGTRPLQYPCLGDLSSIIYTPSMNIKKKGHDFYDLYKTEMVKFWFVYKKESIVFFAHKCNQYLKFQPLLQ